MSFIRTYNRTGKTYYAFFDNKGKLVKYIGNVKKLQLFQQNMQISAEVIKLLSRKPYLNPKACRAIIAAEKREQKDKLLKAFIAPREKESRNINQTCVYCGEAAEEIDHIIPLCLGGIDDDRNKVPVCKKCNLRKGGRPLLTFLKELLKADKLDEGKLNVVYQNHNKKE